jgi:hypothetical protein
MSVNRYISVFIITCSRESQNQPCLSSPLILIPVIPFFVEFRPIRETIETVPEAANALEALINKG